MVHMVHAVFSSYEHTLGSGKMVRMKGCAYSKAKSHEKRPASAQEGFVDSQTVNSSSVLMAKVDCVYGKTSFNMQIARIGRGTSGPIMNSSLDRGSALQALHPDNLQSMPNNQAYCADEHVRQGLTLRRWPVLFFPLSLQAF